MPRQLWYDQIRASDDGSFSRVATLKEDSNIDYQHKRFFDKRLDYLRQKVLTPRADEKSNGFLTTSPRPGTQAAATHRASQRQANNTTLSPCAPGAGPVTRPFNAQARVTYTPATLALSPGHNQRASAELGLFACSDKVVRRSDVGGKNKNGLLRSLQILNRSRDTSNAASPQGSPHATNNNSELGAGIMSKTFDFGSSMTIPATSLRSSFQSTAGSKRYNNSILDSKLSATIDPEKMRERRDKGLKISDDFSDLLSQKPG